MSNRFKVSVTVMVVLILIAGCGKSEPTATPTTTPVPPTATAVPPTNTPLVTPSVTPSATSTPIPPTPAPEPSDAPISLVDSGQRLGAARSWDVELGDLDGDGDLDAFVANGMRGDESSAVWLNDGQGAFTISEQDLGYGMGTGLGDIDGDGDLDAFVMSWDEAGKVWLNDGAGIFADSGQVLGDAGGWEVALGDLDDDGDLDVFVASNGANTVWLNDGEGVFTDTGQRLGVTYTAAVGLGDLDGDGDLDALTVGWDEPGKVWLNDGTGTFTDSEQTLTPGYEHIHGMALADMDGDGALDAFMAGAPNQIWLNDGAGAFGEEIQGLPGLAGDTIAFGDLDGDGDLDVYLAVGDWTASDDTVWLNDGGVQGGTPGHFTDSRSSLSAEFSSGIGLGDLDGDGDLDAFVVHGELGQSSGGGIPNEVWLNETVAPTSEAAPPLSGSGEGLIAFVSTTHSGNHRIYVMNTDGSDQRQLTHGAEGAYPVWSPDGSQIVFHRHQSDSVWSIYVIESDGSNNQRLTTAQARDANPVWSPDGSQIGFSRDGDIWVMNADGSDQRLLMSDPVHSCCIDWSPDGSRIVFESERDGNAEIYVLDVDRSNVQRLTDDNTQDWWPAWSPDSTQIAFMSDRDGDWEIYVMDADGSNRRQLTRNDAKDAEPDWSPDGTQIVFGSDRDGSAEIYVMNADGSDPRRLTNNAARDWGGDWRPVVTTASPAEVAILGDIWTRPVDGMVMVYVPDGAFEMGSTETEIETAISQCKQVRDICTRNFYMHESPQHMVTLDGFWMDRTEVTNAQYRQCVEVGACQAPTACDWGEPTFGDASKADHPVGCVDWYGAQAYCEWVGARLPTEAEWEYAARGEQGNTYPWGNTFDGARLNHCDVNCQEGPWADATVDDGYVESAPVGSYPDGASWCGAFDLAGNAWEWVADWLGAYPSTAQTNPTGPATGSEKVIRGSSWVYDKERFRTAARDFIVPTERDSPIGFRCVSAGPEE